MSIQTLLHDVQRRQEMAERICALLLDDARVTLRRPAVAFADQGGL
jgi:hypothetical protein